jgi:hypothetical protein
MNTTNIEIGTYENYKILCILLEEPYLSGNSKISQLKRWKKYIEYEMNETNKSYTIFKIFKYVNEKYDIRINNKNDTTKYKTNQEYIDFKLEEKEIETINNYKLKNEDVNIISILRGKYKYKKYYPIVKELYILFINGYSPKDLGKVFNKDARTFQLFFKENGLSRDRYEAQAIAKEKRDYKQILNKGRETRLKNNTDINGSKPEIYTRQYLNCRLPLEFPSIEIIVGLNNKSILENGKEIDIPIIIINKDKTYKFAIEYNGDYWHENKNKDINKLEMINQKDYHLFYIAPKQHATNKQIKEYIETQVDNLIIPYIKDMIEKGDKLYG